MPSPDLALSPAAVLELLSDYRAAMDKLRRLTEIYAEWLNSRGKADPWQVLQEMGDVLDE